MATQEIALTRAWLEIGQGPMLIETKQMNYAQLHFGNAAPADDTRAFHELPGPGGFTYGGTSKCFARAAYDTAHIVVTEGS